MPLIQAFADGKTIQMLDESNNWTDSLFMNVEFGSPKEYRIKPEPKYRPFRTVQECLSEMLKHQQFGWLKDKDSELMDIQALTDGVCFRGINLINGWHVFEEAVKEYTFADGTPFGVKIEEDKQ